MKRLDRTLATRGGYSRNISARMIRKGRVVVDGDVCRKSSQKFPEDCTLTVDGFPIGQLDYLLAYHKPEGVVTTVDDPQGRLCVGDILPPRYHIVGRLDRDSRGLLLLSFDGQITQRLLHPKRAVQREYIATVEGVPGFDLIDRVAAGIDTSLGTAKGEILSIEGNQIRIVMREGRNRIVRRMLHNAGHSVIDLFRVRFGPFRLEDLDEGLIRPVSMELLQDYLQQ